MCYEYEYFVVSEIHLRKKPANVLHIHYNSIENKLLPSERCLQLNNKTFTTWGIIITQSVQLQTNCAQALESINKSQEIY